MLKKWKQIFAIAMVLGWSAGAALAGKLTMEGPVSKPIGDPPQETLTVDPQPVADSTPVDGPLLHTRSMEELPMPKSRPATPTVEEQGPEFLGGEEDNGNGDQQGFFAGAGLHILRPVIGNNRAVVATTTSPKVPAASSTTSFVWDFSASPSLSVGYTTPTGLSATLSWFRFDQFSHPRNAVELPGGETTFSSISGFLADSMGFGPGTVPPPAAGQTNVFNLNTSLVLDIWDLDLTQRFTLGQVTGSVGGGIRYLHMSQRYVGSLSQTGLAASAINTNVESSANSFNGVGPTLLADLRRPIGTFTWFSYALNLSLYANARAGLLFGSRHEDFFTASVSNPGGGVATTITPGSPATLRTDQTLGFGEIEMGVEWTGQFGRFYPLARLGFEARDYLNTGNSQSFVGMTHSSDVGLYGIAIWAGVGY